MSNLQNLLVQLPPIRAVHQHGYLLNEEQGSSQGVVTQHDSLSSFEAPEGRFLFQSSDLIQKVLFQKSKLLGSQLAEINLQIEQRRALTITILNHFDKCKTSLRNDELHLETLSRFNTRDPNGLSKHTTITQMQEINRAIAIERQKAFSDEMRLMEERRRLMERYCQYKQSLELFAPM